MRALDNPDHIEPIDDTSNEGNPPARTEVMGESRIFDAHNGNGGLAVTENPSCEVGPTNPDEMQ